MDWPLLVCLTLSTAGGAFVGYKIGNAIGYQRGLDRMSYALRQGSQSH